MSGFGTTTNAFGGFGAQPAAAPSGGLFGSANTGTTNAFGTPAKPAGFGSFGAAATPAVAGTTTPAGTPGGFGSFGPAASTAPKLTFGTPAAPAAGGSLFGASAAPAAAAPAAGGGFFGSAPAAGGGFFGSAPAAAPASTGMFGSAPPAPAAQSTGLFGSTPAAPMATSGGLFGSTTAAAPAATGGLFGSAPAAPAASGSLFGAPAQPAAPAAGGLFGSTAAAPAQNSLFGKPAAIAGGLFGSAAPAQQPTGFGAPQLGASTLAASTLNAPKQEENIETRIVAIKNGWDLNSPECRFKYFFYNVVDEGTTQFYGRPAGATDDAKWARAVRDNPDPMTMVPVLATGWGDVHKRVQALNQTASVHQQRVKELNQALANLNRQTVLSASVRLAALQAHLQQLTQRLLHLAAMSPTFAPTQASAFRPEEAEMNHTLESVKDELDGRVRAHTSQRGVGLKVAPRSQSKGRMLGQINELWGAVEEVRRQRRARGDTSWAGDDRVLAEILLVLEQQQTALGKLGDLASNAVFDADVIRQGIAAVDGRN